MMFSQSYVQLWTLAPLLQLTAASIQVQNAAMVTKHSNSSIHEACVSPVFEFNEKNIENSGTFDFYANWTRTELDEILQNGRSEVQTIGELLFGEQNMKCGLTDKGCSSMPNCHDIGSYMGLDDDKPISPDELLEFRQRYFLSKMILGQLQYLTALRDAIAHAQTTMLGRVEGIVLNSVTQPDVLDINKCTLHKAKIIAAMNAAFTLVATIPDVLTAGATAWTRKALTGIFAGAAIGIVQTVGTGLTAAEMNLIPTTGTSKSQGQLLQTQIDHGVCSDFMGEFQDQNFKTVVEVNKAVEDMFDDMVENVVELANKFTNSSMKATAGEESYLSRELKTRAFYIPWVGEQLNDLAEDLSSKLVEQITDNLVSQSLRSSQCYIQCSVAPDHQTAKKQCSEEGRGNLAKLAGSNHDLATFCPAQELCKTNESSPEPEKLCPQAEALGDANMVCRFGCLQQNEEGKPIWPKALKKLGKEIPVDPPHKLFTDAVLAHRAGLGYFFNAEKWDTRPDAPTFNIPVCISETAFGLDDPPKEDMWPDQFEFTCGDWRANETNKFLNDMPIGNNSEHFQKGEIVGIYKKLVPRLIKNTKYRSPITNYLTYCEAGFDGHDYAYLVDEGYDIKEPWRPGFKALQYGTESLWSQFWYHIGPDRYPPFIPSPRHLYPDILFASFGPDCNTLKEDIQNMDRMEANLWFCLATSAWDFPLCYQFLEDNKAQAKQWYEHWKEFHEYNPRNDSIDDTRPCFYSALDEFTNRPFSYNPLTDPTPYPKRDFMSILNNMEKEDTKSCLVKLNFGMQQKRYVALRN